MTKIRVLIIATNGLGKSGVPNVFMSIVNNMSNHFSFDIVINRKDYYYKKEFESYGGSIYFFNLDYKGNLFGKIYYNLIGKKRIINKYLSDIAKKNKYDIIHSFAEINSYYYFKWAKKAGIRKRIMHVNRIYDMPTNIVSKLHTKYLIAKSCTYSTDRVSVSDLCGNIAFKNKTFQTIYNSIDDRTYNYNIEYMESSPLTLLHVGTILPLKNQLFSIKVIAEIKKTIPNVLLFFIGTAYDKDYYNSCIKLINDKGLENNVSFLPFDEDQKEIIKKTTYALIPSKKEGLSLTTIEAQACGMYCFVSDSITRETDCGSAIFLHLDYCQWANHIIDLYKHNLYRHPSNDVSRFSCATFLSKIKKLYNQ